MRVGVSSIEGQGQRCPSPFTMSDCGRSLVIMEETVELQVGDDVVAVAGARGKIVDIQDMSNGEKVYGVVDVNGAVRHYIAAGIKRFQ